MIKVTWKLYRGNWKLIMVGEKRKYMIKAEKELTTGNARNKSRE